MSALEFRRHPFPLASPHLPPKKRMHVPILANETPCLCHHPSHLCPCLWSEHQLRLGPADWLRQGSANYYYFLGQLTHDMQKYIGRIRGIGPPSGDKSVDFLSSKLAQALAKPLR